MSRSTKQYITVSLICLVIIGGGFFLAFFITTGRMRSVYEAKLMTANQTLAANERMVYVSKDDIPAGGIISVADVEFKSVFSSQPQNIFIDSKDIGKRALIKIPANTQITKAIITSNDVTSDLRETNYTVISNSTEIRNNDTVDVRLLYPNGENYIVLSKKIIMNMKKDSTNSFFWLDEEEIQLMSSAIVDAYLYQGATLYTTKYIEPSIQDASTVTYTPNSSTIKLIEDDPNIIKIANQYLSNILRKELEKRLQQSSDQSNKSNKEVSSNSNVTSDTTTSDNTFDENSSELYQGDDTTQSTQSDNEYYYKESSKKEKDLG